MIVPKNKHTNVGDSEHPGGMKTFCSPSGRYDKSQGPLPADFWTNVKFKSGNGRNGGRYAQRVYLFLSGSHMRGADEGYSDGLHRSDKAEALEPRRRWRPVRL